MKDIVLDMKDIVVVDMKDIVLDMKDIVVVDMKDIDLDIKDIFVFDMKDILLVFHHYHPHNLLFYFQNYLIIHFL